MLFMLLPVIWFDVAVGVSVVVGINMVRVDGVGGDWHVGVVERVVVAAAVCVVMFGCGVVVVVVGGNVIVGTLFIIAVVVVVDDIAVVGVDIAAAVVYDGGDVDAVTGVVADIGRCDVVVDIAGVGVAAVGGVPLSCVCCNMMGVTYVDVGVGVTVFAIVFVVCCVVAVFFWFCCRG